MAFSDQRNSPKDCRNRKASITGVMNFTMTTYSFSRPKWIPPYVSSYMMVLGLMTQPTRMQVAMATTGMRM